MTARQQLYLITEPLPEGDVLREWQWKLGGASTVVALSRSGDAFVRDTNGRIAWLDTGAGTVTPIAESQEAFQALLADPREANQLLLVTVVDKDFETHGPFPAGTCLGFTMLPILGGSYTLENRFRLSAVEHFSVTGDMHRQMRDLPDGAKVRIRITD